MKLVRTDFDQHIRTLLVNVAPAPIRPKITAALSAGPDLGGRARVEQHFGEEYDLATSRAADLADWLDRMMTAHRKTPGLLDWLNFTGFGNDFRLIAAFYEWSQMDRRPSLTVH